MTTPTKPLSAVHIIFDKKPPTAKVYGMVVTVGKPYRAVLFNEDKRLYTLQDDNLKMFNVSLYGRTYENNGYWHLQEDEAEIKRRWGDDDDDDDDDDNEGHQN